MIIFSMVWCVAIMADSHMPEAQQFIVVIINSYYFKGCCRILGIYFNS